MSDDKIEDVFGDGSQAGEATEPQGAAPADKPAAKKAPAKKKPVAKKDDVERTWIILAKNDDIPPSGLFIGHNGVGYNLKPGKKAHVPNFLLNVLDDAVVKKPIVGDNGRVIGYEDSPRFPYQVVREK